LGIFPATRTAARWTKRVAGSRPVPRPVSVAISYLRQSQSSASDVVL
jgi:hypothetical protein